MMIQFSVLHIQMSFFLILCRNSQVPVQSEKPWLQWKARLPGPQNGSVSGQAAGSIGPLQAKGVRDDQANHTKGECEMLWHSSPVDLIETIWAGAGVFWAACGLRQIYLSGREKEMLRFGNPPLTLSQLQWLPLLLRAVCLAYWRRWSWTEVVQMRKKKEIYTVVTDSELLKALSLGPQLNAVSKPYKRAI